MAKLLPQIQGPADLKGLTAAELNQLAGEIREEILNTLAEAGGHLGANLGSVELTIALHRVFDSPADRIIWDVGHQGYPHKLLTGRQEVFHTLRQHGGISGFLKRKESPHDVWEAGHASTSVSAAMGFAKARDLRGERHEVIAVIGDGALTGGMAYEALNNIGHDATRVIVVLNDNSMSIAPNVGAINHYLGRLRVQPSYDRVKEDLNWLLRRIPRIGPSVARTVERLKDSLKYLIVPGVWFEELGFTYLGPVDGHNILSLEEAFRRARRVRGPVLIHAMTRKGMGYWPAENDYEALHGTGPFDKTSGKSEKKKGGAPAYTKVFSQTLIQLAKTDRRIVAITAAMPSGTGLDAFAREYPNRTFDVGIAEQHAVTFAAGLASQDLRPVAAIYSTFLQRAYDQILHDVCQQNLPVRFAIDRAGLVGADGETHNGVFDLAYLRPLPNMVIMAPADENELRHMLKTAVEYDAGPSAVRYPRGSGLGVALDEELQALPIGQGELRREGQDVALVALGSMVSVAEAAADLLKERGIAATVVNARFVKPLDLPLISRVATATGAVVTLEEHQLMGGFGSAVFEALNEEGLNLPMLRLGLPDRFIPHGDPKRHLADLGLDSAGVASSVYDFLRRRGQEYVRPVGDAAGGQGA